MALTEEQKALDQVTKKVRTGGTADLANIPNLYVGAPARNRVRIQQKFDRDTFDQGLASLHTGQNLMDLNEGFLNEGLEPTPLMPPQQGGGPIGFLKKLINIAVMMSPAGKAITIGKILHQLQQAPDKMVFIKKLGTNLAQMVARNKLGADRFDLARSGYNLATDKSSFGDEAGRLFENKAYRMGNEAILKKAYERGGMDDVRRTAALLKAGSVPTGR